MLEVADVKSWKMCLKISEKGHTSKGGLGVHVTPYTDAMKASNGMPHYNNLHSTEAPLEFWSTPSRIRIKRLTCIGAMLNTATRASH